LFVAVVVGLTALSGSNANTIQFADAFNGSTLDPFWNANYMDSGYVTYPSSYLGAPCVQLSTVAPGTDGGFQAFLVHDFSGPTYGDASIWFYDTGAGQSSGNYIQFLVGNTIGPNNWGPGCASLFTDDFDLPGNGDTYQYKANGGGSATAAPRTQAWHLLEIDDTPSSLILSVDGTMVYSGAGGTPFTQIGLGLGSIWWRPSCTTYFRDFSFNGQTVPEPSSFVLLAAGAMGLLGYGFRRRRVARRTAKPAAFNQ
jgi:hypothetical protein